MNTNISGPWCMHCGHPLSATHSGPCPKCGKNGKIRKVALIAAVKTVASVSYEKTHVYLEKHPVILTVYVAIVIGSPFLGLALVGWPGVIVGLVVSVFGFALGLRAIIKVREITRGSS